MHYAGRNTRATILLLTARDGPENWVQFKNRWWNWVLTHVCRLFACARSGFGCCPHRWSDQRCFDPGRHEGIGGRATPKPVQGQDRAQAPAGEGLRSLPLPMGHAPAAARSRRWSADPLLKCNPTNWKSKRVVGKVLSKNVKIRKCVFFIYLIDSLSNI